VRSVVVAVPELIANAIESGFPKLISMTTYKAGVWFMWVTDNDEVEKRRSWYSGGEWKTIRELDRSRRIGRRGISTLWHVTAILRMGPQRLIRRSGCAKVSLVERVQLLVPQEMPRRLCPAREDEIRLLYSKQLEEFCAEQQ